MTELGRAKCLRHATPTSGYPEHPHNADDGWVDREGRVDLDLLQGDSHDGQEDNGQVQLVPSEKQGFIQMTVFISSKPHATRMYQSWLFAMPDRQTHGTQILEDWRLIYLHPPDASDRPNEQLEKLLT